MQTQQALRISFVFSALFTISCRTTAPTYGVKSPTVVEIATADNQGTTTLQSDRTKNADDVFLTITLDDPYHSPLSTPAS
jgi:hypothetical protein